VLALQPASQPGENPLLASRLPLPHDVVRRNFASLKGHAGRIANLAKLIGYDVARLTDLGRSIRAKETASHSQFYPVCFTCGKHFDFLRLAVFSLALIRPQIKTIHIFMDKCDVLTPAQCNALESETRFALRFEKTRFAMAQGVRVFLSELEAYRHILGKMEKKDYLMKFDSDVIFKSGKLFDFVESCGAQAVGTGIHQVQQRAFERVIHPRTDDMQGGCYFIKAPALKAIVSSTIASSALPLFDSPEDQFISRLLRTCGAKVLFDEFLYFDPQFALGELTECQLDARVRMIPASASVVHFEGDKRNMWRVSKKLLPSLPS